MLRFILILFLALLASGCAGMMNVTTDSRYHGTYNPNAVYRTKKLLFLSDGAFWRPNYGGTPPTLEAFTHDEIGTWRNVTGAVLPGTRIRIESIQIIRFGGSVGRSAEAYGLIIDGKLAGKHGTLQTISDSTYVKKLGASVPLLNADLLEIENEE